MLNNIFIMGRLTRDPELRTTPGGKFITSFTVAVDRDYDREKTDFFYCSAWNKTAEFVSRNFKKGQMALVAGSMQSRDYTDKNNTKHTVWEINVNNVYFADSKKPEAKPDVKVDAFEELDDGEELPF